ncbi:hypothetical protein A8709_32985 [Paenibacillus pectinilyticus]|uniref:HNH nuclease domain-containing protein n=1 Tax=Paenibacillus pectinilyticus TaxID=512399 RepID=A0A1C0ZX12_9BACL|nr:HNH endonuclease signature motif containing protein [Paenibacillus pectinilyticus]OCT12627.1 hypothetical protein A8709_32985 [Paenibacillus pectinilyticus]
METQLPKRFIDKVDFTGSCWIWMASKVGGRYGQYRYKGKMGLSHRFSWEHFNGTIPPEMRVLHKCDVPSCVNPLHLFLGTNQDNTDDMMEKGRHVNTIKKGEEALNVKLSQRQVDEIRETYQRRARNEFSTIGLAKKFGVSNQQISRIINNKRWTG